MQAAHLKLHYYDLKLNFHNNDDRLYTDKVKYDPDGVSKDSQDVGIYCDDNRNKLDTKQCHSYSSQLQGGFTAYERQAWTNYENNGNYLIVGDVVRFEYSNIRGSVFLITVS